MNWEPWTGCYKISEGCSNCYFYGPHGKRYGQNIIQKTEKFDLPIRRNKKDSYILKSGVTVPTCFATDFFIPEADEWRREAWAIIRERKGLNFLILTKRIERFSISLPPDWDEGYDNVIIGCTVENQNLADYRLPLFLSYPIKHRFIACTPILEPIDLSFYLTGVEHVTVGGESGRDARLCDYNWITNIREQCIRSNVTFWFKNTGSIFKYNGKILKINPFKQASIARSFNINILNDKKLF